MVEIESEGALTRGEVAAFLREFADELDDGRVGTETETSREGIAGRQADERQDERGETAAHDPKRITVIVGGDSATVTVPETLDFEVEVESRSPMLSSGVNQEIEFELSWEIENPDEIRDEWLEVE